MPNLTQSFARFARNDDGATMVEYAILVALISVVAILMIDAVGTKVLAAFTAVDAQMP